MDVHHLVLYQDLLFSRTQSGATSPAETLRIYRNGVARNNLEAPLEQYLRDGEDGGFGYYGEDGAAITARIPRGTYLFIQRFVTDTEPAALRKAALKCAEALFLESLWEETPLKDTVYVRMIQEDGKLALQVLRQLDGAAGQPDSAGVTG